MTPIETSPAGLAGLTPVEAAAFVTDEELAAEVAALQAQINGLALGGTTDNELLALADTVAAADQLPYFDSDTTAATTPLSAFARTILDDATAAEVRATIGAGLSDVTLPITEADVTNLTADLAAKQGSDPQLDSLAALSSVANLTAFAGLSGITNTIPYFTSAGVMGLLTLDATTTLGTSDTAVPTQKAVKAYADAAVGGGGADASTTTKGIAKLSVAATTAANPIAVGDNDPRLVTAAANTALTALGTVVPAADSMAYFTSTTQATTSSLTSFGRALVGQSTTANARTALGLAVGTDVQAYDADLTTLGALGSGARTALGLAIGTNVQAWDADLDTLATMGTTRASAVAGISTYVQTLLDDTTSAVARGTLLADDFASMVIYGHSINYTGSSPQGVGANGLGHRIARALGVDPDWWAIALSPLSANVPGLAGWDHLYRHTEGVPGFSTSSGFQQAGGMQNPQRDAAFIFHGINDVGLPATGGGGLHQYSDLLPFRHALRASISRLLMSNLFEEDDADTVDFDTTGSGWSARTGVTSAAGSVYNGSGGFYQVNTVVNKVITIAVTSAFEGGTVAFGFLSDTAGRGANFSIKEGATTLTTVDARTANAVWSGTSYWTPVVARTALTAAGAHTITITPTAISTQCYFDAWWIESNDAPLVCVAKQYQVTGGGYTAAYQTQLEQSIVDVVAEFGSNVFTMETNDLIAAAPTTVLNDAVHLNDRGAGMLASRAVDTFMSKNRTRDSHGKGAMYAPFLTRKPIQSTRNRIQPNMANVVPLTIASAQYSAAATADLLNFTDGNFSTVASVGYDGMLSVLASTVTAGTTAVRLNLGNSASLLHTAVRVEDADAFDTPFIVYALSTDTTSRFRIQGNGQVGWGPGGTDPLDSTISRSATAVLQVQGALIVTGGVTVTGAATHSSTLSGTTAIFNNGVTITGALTTSNDIATTGVVRINSATTTAGIVVTTPAAAAARAVVVNLGQSSSLLHQAFRTEDTDALDTAFSIWATSTDTTNVFRIQGNGQMNWGAGGSAALDVTMNRTATSVMTMTSSLIVSDSVRLKVVAGTISDASFATTPGTGHIAVDSTNSKLWVRVGSTWKSVAVA